MSLVVGLVTILLTTLLAGAIYVGQLAVEKEEMRNTADALAMTGAAIYARGGEAALNGHAGFNRVMTGGSNLSGGWNFSYRVERVEQPDGSFKVRVIPELSGERSFQNQLLGADPFTFQMGESSSAETTEIIYDEVERRLPKLVLVLDYSGSMAAQFGGTSRIDALRTAVFGLLDQELDVEYGLVLFDAGVSTVVAVDDDRRQDDIRNAMLGRGPGGRTNYADPTRRATQLLLNEENTGYYILFVGDGEPNAPNNARRSALDASNAARGSDVSIFTLFIGSPTANTRGLMIAMGGGPQDPGDPRYHFEAGNNAQLQEEFRRIIAEIVCTIGPLEPRPDPEYMFVALRDRNNTETPLDESFDIVGDRDRMRYQYVADENKMRLTARACDHILDDGAALIIRTGRPRMAFAP